MQLGLAIFNGVSPETMITCFRKYGIRHTFLKAERPDFEDVLKLLMENDIVCDNLHAPFLGINAMWGEDEQAGADMLAQLKACVDKCAKYGIPTAIVHLSSGKPMPEITQVGLRRYEELFAYAQQKGVQIALENLRFGENLAYFMEHYPQCGYCWDCGHQYAYKHTRYLHLYGNRLKAMHIHDNRCGVDTDDHMLPFDGNIPMEQVAKDIADSGYAGTLMLEVGRLIVTETYHDLTEEIFMDRAAKAAIRLNEMVEACRRA